LTARLYRVWGDYSARKGDRAAARASYERAMASAETKQLRIAAAEETGKIVIRFEDTGTGIATPEKLFQPFQTGSKASGLGLYVSRAIMRSFGGDICYEHRVTGCCFVVVVPLVAASKEAIGA